MTGTSILTDWREGIKALLAEDLQDGQFEIRDGERDGAVTDAADGKIGVCSVWAPNLPVAEADLLFITPTLMVRAWIAKAKRTPKAKVPRDPSDLEQLAVDLNAVLWSTSTSLLVGQLIYQVAEVVLDYEDWGVQATLTSFALNVAGA